MEQCPRCYNSLLKATFHVERYPDNRQGYLGSIRCPGCNLAIGHVMAVLHLYDREFLKQVISLAKMLEETQGA